MTEQPENQVPDEGAVPSWAPAQPSDPAAAPAASAGGSDRPEVAIGAAFAGGFVLAMLLKRLAR